MLQEEALKRKESLKDSSLDSFTASNGWLEKWKAVYLFSFVYLFNLFKVGTTLVVTNKNQPAN